ncbi:MAG: hypothetical protein FWC93_05510, partial [Defluviitaleaceae bacterium]|nr:hypothetical protein [Defluviitaleaceae bacterium]
NPIHATHRGLDQWAKLQHIKDTAAAYALMQSYGGIDTFMKLYHECRLDVQTLENGIAANDEQIKAWGYLQKDIATYRRTQPIYKQYREMKRAKNNITFFGKDKAEEFRKNHEDDISAHEIAMRDLEGYEKPYYSNKTITAEIEKIKTANVKNNKALTQKKAELKQAGRVHSYLFDLDRQHQPKQEKQQQRRRSKVYDVGL